MAASKIKPKVKTKGKSSQLFRTQKPAADPKGPVGTGMFAVTGEAAKRLENNPSGYPGGPLPFTQAIAGESVVTPQRLWYHKLTRFNPIRQLKPETLAHYFDLFQQGYLRYLDLMVDAIENRDPILKNVIAKRKAAVKRLRWEIIIQSDLDAGEQSQAEAQKEKLFQFYNNLRATSAVDLNIEGGVPLLIEQMIGAKGHKYAVHEIIYQPEQDYLTAKFNFIPLWFFENRTGKLRFLEMDYSIDGRTLKDGSFMTTCGEGLLEPCAVAYMFKHLCMRDWLMYCEKCAMPGIFGKTDSPYGSPSYNALTTAVHDIATDFSCVIGLKDEIDSIDFSRAGELPYEKLVDYMDRVMISLWRGADLSTMSGRTPSGGQGALLQGKEEYNLQCDDAALISETFNLQVDPQVIKYFFGKDAKQLVYFKLVVPPNIEASTDITIINALLSWGIDNIGKDQMLEHFGIGKMMQGDTPITPPPIPGKPGQGGGELKTFSDEMEVADEARKQFGDKVGKLFANALIAKNETFLKTAELELAQSTKAAMAPLLAEIVRVRSMANEGRLQAMRDLKQKLPDLLEGINKEPANAVVLADAMSSAWFNGLFAAYKSRGRA